MTFARRERYFSCRKNKNPECRCKAMTSPEGRMRLQSNFQQADSVQSIRQTTPIRQVLSPAVSLGIHLAVNIFHRYAVHLAKRYNACFLPVWKLTLKSQLWWEGA